MPEPVADHPITIRPASRRWRAFFNGHVIADSADALVLQEADLRPVVYFPREDVAMEYFSRTDRTTHCPHKGEAAYYTLLLDGAFAENVAWTYEAPHNAVGLIARRLAFYPDQVEVYEVDDARVNPHHHEHHTESTEVDEIVQHTDSGSGRAQREPWPSNVESPDGGLR